VLGDEYSGDQDHHGGQDRAAAPATVALADYVVHSAPPPFPVPVQDDTSLPVAPHPPARRRCEAGRAARGPGSRTPQPPAARWNMAASMALADCRLCDSCLMDLGFAGAVLDLGISDLRLAETFYTILIGREPDLRLQPGQLEWRLHSDPEIALRITADHPSAGHGSVAIGVTDLAAERSRLLAHWPDLPDATEKPGVITLLSLRDPDANAVTLWQDLLGSRRA
jgi:hypothetical protein